MLQVEDAIHVVHMGSLPALLPGPSEWKHHFIPGLWLSLSKRGAFWGQRLHSGGVEWSVEHTT